MLAAASQMVGRVDAEQLRAPLQRCRDRPAQVWVVPSPHPNRLGAIAAGSLSAFRGDGRGILQVGGLDGINGLLVMHKSRVRIPQAARRTPCALRTRPPQRPASQLTV